MTGEGNGSWTYSPRLSIGSRQGIWSIRHDSLAVTRALLLTAAMMGKGAMIQMDIEGKITSQEGNFSHFIAAPDPKEDPRFPQLP